MMDNEFSNAMQQRTDEELLHIVTDLRNEYQPEAVSAAETELQNRNIPSEKMDYLLRRVEHVKKARHTKSQKPLPAGLKVLAALLPGLALLIIASVLNDAGYKNASKGLFFWTMIGIAIWISMIFTIEFLHHV
jgi:hypothetical protein